MHSSLTFNKQERLKSRKLIEQVFSDGKSFSVFPIKLIYEFTQLPGGVPLQATVSVSKRNFKKAADRNRIKRMLREVYRLQKLPLQHKLKAAEKQLALFFIYTGKTLPEYADLNDKMGKVLARLEKLAGPDPIEI